MRRPPARGGRWGSLPPDGSQDSPGQDSNLRPPAYGTGELPLLYPTLCILLLPSERSDDGISIAYLHTLVYRSRHIHRYERTLSTPDHA